MSYEGEEHYLCKDGHYWIRDCHEVYDEDASAQKCPICGRPAVWWNPVDLTNGSFYVDPKTGEETRIDGYVKLKIDKDGRKVKKKKEEKLHELIDIAWRVMHHLCGSLSMVDSNLGLELKEALEAYMVVKDASTFTTYKIPIDKGRKI